jgi:hypothetical protein
MAAVSPSTIRPISRPPRIPVGHHRPVGIADTDAVAAVEAEVAGVPVRRAELREAEAALGPCHPELDRTKRGLLQTAARAGTGLNGGGRGRDLGRRRGSRGRGVVVVVVVGLVASVMVSSVDAVLPTWLVTMAWMGLAPAVTGIETVQLPSAATVADTRLTVTLDTPTRRRLVPVTVCGLLDAVAPSAGLVIVTPGGLGGVDRRRP